MKEFKYVITDSEGIHARPAGVLQKKAKACTSKVTIIKGGKAVDASKLLALMSLGVKCGEEVTIQVEGPDEEKDAAEMEAFMKETL
ncbi:MAG: HPr family phosphocarrier protein [Lachnospiraceae bacterium]|nr:HPr family phosphocarrier protein [Lachnospiraceae bacterium]